MSGFAKTIATSRFSTLLSKSDCPRPLYDQVLARLHNCVVTPTRGSILPHWLLIVPEEPVLNFSEWYARGNIDPGSLVGELLRNRRVNSSRAIWFEHGPAHVEFAVGCGVDHAHIHVLIDVPFSFIQMISTASMSGDLRFTRARATSAYGLLTPASSYLLLASGEEAFVAENVEHVGSQFLRRVVADLAGSKDAWNYHTHPHIHNVQKTIQAFCAA